MLDRIALGVVSRIIYILVALAAIWCITLFFREHTFLDEPQHQHSGQFAE